MFDQYRQFIQRDPRHQHVRELYTETEVLIALEAETIERKSERPDQESEPGQKQVERFPVLEGLRRIALGYERQHVMLAGRPGSGKSTTLQRLLLELADAGPAEATVIPVYVQLKSDRSITDLILAEFRKAKVRVTLEQLDDWLLQDQLLLLLDGVNEIPSEERRRQLQDFREDNPTTPMIFTTRDLSVGGDLGIEQRLEMRPLSEPQMREFVGKYLANRGMPDQADTLLRQLSDRLREIAETPLLLKLLCDVFDPATRQIPQSKGALFRQFDQKYDRIKKDTEYVPVSDHFWDFKAEILQFLAFAMIQTDDKTSVEAWYSLPRDRVETLLETWLKDRGVIDPATKAKLWLKDLCRCHLLQDAKDPGDIEFHHQLFQEYYAAEYLLRLLPTLSDEELKQNHLNLLKWAEPIALMLSLVDDENQARRVVKLAMNDVDLMLGARLAGEVGLSFQSNTIDLINALDIPVQLKYQCWGMSQSEAAIPALLDVLEDSNASVRQSAADALGKINSEAAIVRLLTTTLEDTDPWTRQSAAETLGKINSDAAIVGLLQALEHSDEDVRLRAADAFVSGQINSKAAIVGLLQALEHSDEDVRWSAAEALGELKSEAAIPGLLNALEDADKYVRWSAAKALGNLKSEAAIPDLLQALKDTDEEVRQMATEALGQLNSEATIPALLQMLEDSDEEVRMRAAGALGKFSSDAAIVGLLKTTLEDADEGVRQMAAHALGSLNSEAATPGLLNALEGVDPSTRPSAAIALSHLNSEAAIPGLLNALEDADKFVRWGAAIALGNLNSEAGIAALLQALEHSDKDVRRSAAIALGNLNSEAAIPGLLNALEDSSAQVCQIAAEVLCDLGGVVGERAAISLVQVTKAHDAYLRQVAVEYLGEITTKNDSLTLPTRDLIIETLIHALQDKEFSIRRNAAEAIGKIGNPQPLAILQQQLTSSSLDNYSAISAIQNRCQFYNYEIWQESIETAKLESQNKEQIPAVGQTTNVFNIPTLQANNSPINLGGTIQRDQIGTQNPKPES